VLRIPIAEYVIAVQPVGEHATLDHGRERLDQTTAEVLPVVNQHGRISGVLSRTDLFHASRHSVPPGAPVSSFPGSAQVSSVMTRSPVVVAPSTSVGEAASMMVDQHIHHLLVEADQRVIGVFGVLEVMRALVDAAVATPLSALMTRPVYWVNVDSTVEEASEVLARRGVNGLAVMEAGVPVGVFTKRDVLDAGKDLQAPIKQVLGQRSPTLPAATPAYVAADRAISKGLPHVLVTGDHASAEGAPMLVGIVTGIDLAGAAMLASG